MKKLVVTFATLVVAVGAYAKWGGIGGIAAKEALSLAVKVATDSTKTDESDKNSPTATGAGNSTTVAVPEQVTTSQENLGQPEQAEQEAVATTQKPTNQKSEAAANDPQEVVKIEDDNKFLELLKDAWHTAVNGSYNDDVCIDLAYRASEVKDQKRLVEYLRNHDDGRFAMFVAISRCYWSFRDPDWLKDPELAEVFIDNLFPKYCKTRTSLGSDLFGAVARLDAKGREKYLKRARENLEKAKNDSDVVVFEKYYVGMPIMDCIMFSFEDQLDWVKRALGDRNAHWFFENWSSAEDEELKKLKDWKSEWKVTELVFVAKDRQRCFKVKGTLEGFLTFIKKYIDKSAELGDITIDGGWWLYRDDEHERKIYLNDKTGVLNIK